MATKERRARPRKPTSKPDTSADNAPGNPGAAASAEEIRALIAEAAYYRAKQRGFAPGHEMEDWVAAEAEIMRRIERPHS